MRALSLTSLLLVSAASLLAGPESVGKRVLPSLPLAPTASPWRIGAGWQYRSLGDFSFTSTSRSANFRLPTLPAGRGNKPFSSGNDSSEADRSYDDGYVFQDQGTPVDGLTAFWGYQNDSQLDLTTHPEDVSTLTVHDSSLSSQASAFRNRQVSTTRNEEADGWGPFAQISYVLPVKKDVTVTFDGVFSYLPFESSQWLSNPLAGQRSSFRTASRTDTFEIASTPENIPLGGYKGTYDSVSPIIYNVPIDRTTTAGKSGSNSVNYRNALQNQFKLDNFTLSLGSSVTWTRGPLTVVGGAGASLNIASWDASQNETIYVRKNGGSERVLKRWSDQRSETDLLPGFYLQGGAELALGRGFYLTAFGRYDWGKDLTGTVGPSAFSLAMDGWTVGGGLLVRF
jgi:hypothetical protein